MTEVREQVEDVAAGATDKVSDVSGAIPMKKIVLPVAAAAVGTAATFGVKKFGPGMKASAKDKVSKKVVDTASGIGESALDSASEAGGITGMVAKVAKKATGGGGDGGGMLGGIVGKLNPFGGGKGKEPSEGWGKGRRNPIQLTADVGVPVEVAYDQWTQFEEFPKFMHRVTSVTTEEDDPTKVKWQVKIWFSKREWEAQIVDQWPDERIGWRTTQGAKHVGWVTFTSLGPNLTRIVVNLDFSPSGIKEKMASGLRFVKRAAKSDVYRSKAFIESHKEATGTWRGRIEDGEVVEDAEPEEGKPFEEGQELRKPTASGKQKDMKKKGDDDKKDDDADDDKKDDDADENGDDDSDEQDAQAKRREEREKRREEREQKAA